MQFDAFPFDVHNCFFRVQSLETPESALIFRYDPNAPGVIWKTQTILEHSVRFKKLEEVSYIFVYYTFSALPYFVSGSLSAESPESLSPCPRQNTAPWSCP